MTKYANKAPIPQYSDPAEPNLISDGEDSLDFSENVVESSASQTNANGNTFSKHVRINSDEAPHQPIPSTSHSQQQKHLLGILEVSKYFCHDNLEDHNSEIERGVASGLAALLRRSLFFYEQGREKRERSKDFKTSGLEYIVSLSTSLTMVLHCSEPKLEHHIQEFESDLLAALQTIGNIFGSHCEEDSILTTVVLKNVCRTVGLIHRYVIHHTEMYVEILLKIVTGESSPNCVKVDAADTIFLVLETFPLQTNPGIVKLLEANSSALISVLSTAAIPVSDDDLNPTLRLFDLASVSVMIRAKMMKRRCTVLAVVRHFRHASMDVRRKAYLFCQEIVDDPDASNSYSSSLFLENVVVDALVEAAAVESDPDTQVLAASLLCKITKIQPFPSTAAMDQARRLAFSASNESIATECGVAYCEGMKKEPFPNHKHISALLDFTTLPYANVRAKAFESLETLLTKSESVEILLKDTPFLEKFEETVSDGSDDDCEAALNILRQLSRSSRHHDTICQHASLLGSLIAFVAQEDVTNRKAHFYGVEIILALLSNGETTAAFLPFRRLLPWLVSFLNRTTADDAFKEQVVAVIIRLSTAYLEQDE
ncbi:hypothetical protein IV203_036245 [Nitzschia inconspicua]|uniref:Uncharacterized protein n=1 Tax=Nitzschia inconspicua TaxID=303405 RepID=A0A9K3LET2_9STRA|nr:hypothetical protein IV203_036245 [Nitzschia inconspicua]